MDYDVVENPRRRRDSKGRFLKKGRSRRKSRKRRNGAMASYRVNGGKRRTTRVRNRRSTSTYRRPRRSSRRRNPMLGGFGGMFDIPSLLQMSLGGLGVKLVPGLVKQMVWDGLPTTGLTGKLVQVGTAFGLAMVTRQFVGRRAAQNVFNGAMTVTAIELLSEYVMPAVGLSGYVRQGSMSSRELAPLRGYVYNRSGRMAAAAGGMMDASLTSYAS